MKNILKYIAKVLSPCIGVMVLYAIKNISPSFEMFVEASLLILFMFVTYLFVVQK